MSTQRTKIVGIEQEVNRDNLIYKTGDSKNDWIFDFQKFKTIRSIESDLRKGNNTLEDVVKDQVILVDPLNNFNSSTNPRKGNKKD